MPSERTFPPLEKPLLDDTVLEEVWQKYDKQVDITRSDGDITVLWMNI